VTGRNYQRVADLRVSTTDPDASMMLTKGGSHLGYQTHYVVDGGKARIILNVLVAPSEVSDISAPTFLCLITIIAPNSLALKSSNTRPRVMSMYVRQAKNSTMCKANRPTSPAAIVRMPKTVMLARLKRSVPLGSRDVASVAVCMRSI
jgi:hypothetical protein